MKIKFLGATRNVTGSRFLLDAGNRRILIDCGLFQERDFTRRNWADFPFPPAEIDAVILTHAHLDHCGYLPKLVREGFKGSVFCTPPTADITKITLLDSGRIQEEDAEKKRLRHEREGRRGPYPEKPLYTAKDAALVVPRFKTYPYGQEFEAADGIGVSFRDAGHILGAAMVQIVVKKNGARKTLVFSGDIGRWDKPILCDPALFEAADYLVMETTYGNRTHENQENAGDKFAEIIRETAEKAGNIVIPTFAVERAQELLYCLSKFLREDRIPHLVTFVDSPMAINVTEVFNRYPEYFDETTKNLIRAGKTPFDFPLLNLTRTADESKAINHIRGSAVIMAGSGMCTGGRIKHHLVANIGRPASTVLFVGYQAAGTLGRQILNRPESVRILGREYPVKARIEQITGFSAHADREELLRWLGGFQNAPEKIFLVHGEEQAMTDFSARLKAENRASEILMPEYLDEYEL